MRRLLTAGSVLGLVLFAPALASARDVIIPVSTTTPGGEKALGTVTASDTKYGLLLTPALSGLPAGIHGFHIHANPQCGADHKDGQHVPGLKAGGHFDPKKTGKHLGPYGAGHLGDLPVLFVAADGKAAVPLLAPRLKVKDILGRSLMIHAGGDNYSDAPAPLGGGGARIGCGVIPAK